MKENAPMAYPIFIAKDSVTNWHPGRFIAWGTSGEFRHTGCGEIYPSVLLRKPDGRVIERTADGIYLLKHNDEWQISPFESFLWWLFPGALDTHYS